MIGDDRVQVTKVESTALGGNDADQDPYGAPVPIDAQEDAIECAGMYVQDESNRDETVGAYREDDDLFLFDNNLVNQYPGHSLTMLAFSGWKKVKNGETKTIPSYYSHVVSFMEIEDGGTLILEDDADFTLV